MNEKSAKHSLLDYCKNIPKDSPSRFDQLLLEIKEPIATSFDRPLPAIQCVDYSYVSGENAKGVGLQHPSDYLAADASPDEQYATYQIFLLRQENIRILGLKFLHPGDEILEIGAGMLDKAGDSNVSSAFPKEIAAGFSFCDINPTIVEQSLVLHPRARIRQSDILRLKNDYPKESYSRIVGVNILDTLAKEDLGRCMRELHYVLKPYGTLIHYMHLEPFIYALVHNLMDEEEILIPLLDQERAREFLRIKKDRYFDTIRDELVKKGVEQEKIDFLDFVSSLTRIQQERLCNAIIFSDNDSAYAALGREMQKWGETVTLMTFYEQIIKEALETNGFRIDESHYAVSEKTVRASVGSPYDQQKVTYGPTGKQSEPNDALGWGHGHFKILTHGIIATALP